MELKGQKNLLKFFKEEVKTVYSRYEYWEGQLAPRIWAYRLHHFPNARGVLGRRLEYTETIEGGLVVEHYYNHDKDADWKDYKIILYDKEAHQLREKIINKIKSNEQSS